MVLFLLSFPGYSKEIGGVELPGSITVDDQELVLNGAGLRKKFFFKIYACGLYLENPSGDAGRIIRADKAMALRLHFIYKEVPSEKVKESFQEGFDSCTVVEIDKIRNKIERFFGFLRTATKKGDIYQFNYLPGQGVRVLYNGEALGEIEGLDFKKALFCIWLGENTNLPDLKPHLLGN